MTLSPSYVAMIRYLRVKYGIVRLGNVSWKGEVERGLHVAVDTKRRVHVQWEGKVIVPVQQNHDLEGWFLWRMAELTKEAQQNGKAQ